ncbi:hypothetical protein Nepgr_033411 [Nepenthes gracilis]|uniref:Uncharacterized protein n=1 Tax=Nepenthes gracilis TaxID=150966 RepID=A0AAD3TLD6_NEPGR|nr:hypothetical protein Nepgr_033411 [Nepenthes gracilis]
MDLSSSQTMMLAVRDDTGSLSNMVSCDAQNCKHQHMDDLRTAQYSAKAHEDTAQSDTASYNGSHCWPMPTCSRSAQTNAYNILSLVETSNSVGRLPSDEISIAGVKGDVDADAGTNPRDEHVLLSYSEVILVSMLSSEKQEPEYMYLVLQCSLNKNETRLPTAVLNTSSYADKTMRRIDDARVDEPGISAALSSLQPITDEERLAALDRPSCRDEIIGSPTLGSSHHIVLVDPPCGEPRPYISIGKLRRNITDLRKSVIKCSTKCYCNIFCLGCN